MNIFKSQNQKPVKGKKQKNFLFEPTNEIKCNLQIFTRETGFKIHDSVDLNAACVYHSSRK